MRTKRENKWKRKEKDNEKDVKGTRIRREVSTKKKKKKTRKRRKEGTTREG